MIAIDKATYGMPASAAGQYIKKFISESDRSAETGRVYDNALSIFTEWAEDMPITAPMIRTFKTYLKNKGLAPNTISVYLSAIKQFLAYLVEKGAMLYNPAKEVKRPRIPRMHQRDALTAESARLLLNAVSRESAKGLRDFAMINLMLRTGIREIEVSRALIGDIAEKEGERILEIHGKGRDLTRSNDLVGAVQPKRNEPFANMIDEQRSIVLVKCRWR